MSEGNCRFGKTFKKRKRRRIDHVQTKSIYPNRAFGSDCHCCIVDGDLAAGTAAGEKAGKDSSL